MHINHVNYTLLVYRLSLYYIVSVPLSLFVFYFHIA